MESQTITLFLNRYLYYPVVLIFVVNLIQRQYKQGANKKRYATLYMGVFFIVLWGYTFLLLRFALGDLWLVLIVGAGIALAVIKRNVLFPFRPSCSRCGKGVTIRTMFFEDEDLCADCRKTDAEAEGRMPSDGRD